MSSESCQLSEIADVQGGYAFKSADFGDEGVAVIKIANIQPPQVSLAGVDRVSPDKIKGLERFELKDGDILMAMTGATVGKVGRFRRTESAYLNQRVARVAAKKGRQFDNFIYAILSLPGFDKLIEGSSAGSAQANISAAGIGSVKIPRLSETDQLLIGNLARLLDDRIALLRETNATLEAIAQAMFKSWFVDFDPVHAKQQGRAPEGMSEATPARSTPEGAPGVPPDPSAATALFPDSFEESELGLVPMGWKVEPLTEVFDFREGPGIRNWQYTNSDQGTRFINIRCIQDGDLSIETASRITNEEANGKYAHFHLKAWDVVVSTSGTLGRSAIVRQEHLPLMLNTSVIRFQPIKEKMRFSFVYEYLNSTEFLFKLESMASGSVQKNFGPMHLKQMKLVCPPIDLLAHYDSICRPLFEKVVANRARIQTLSTLCDTLLPRLISGQLRLPEAESALEEVAA